jgi:signal transduction histidine kinase
MAVPDRDPSFDLARCEAVFKELRRRGKVVFESVHELKSGKILPVELTISHFNLQGKEWIIGFIHDIESRKKIEGHLQNGMMNRDRAIGVLSHDLRGPLGSIFNIADILQTEFDFSGHENYPQMIKNIALRMLEMIESILDFARIRFAGGDIPLLETHEDIRELCQNIVAEITPVWPGREISFSSRGDGQGLWDKGRINQIIYNLISNALSHGQPDRVVRLDLTCELDEIILSVHNYGEPIPSKLLPDLFEPFQKTDKSSSGLGLGLYIVNRLVDIHQGTIVVNSDKEIGTTFELRLPRKSN